MTKKPLHNLLLPHPDFYEVLPQVRELIASAAKAFGTRADGRPTPIHLCEPLADHGSLGHLLLKEKIVNSISLNVASPQAFAFLSVAYGRTCGNRREANYLSSMISELDLDAPPECSSMLKDIALAYVCKTLREVRDAGLDWEAHREAILQTLSEMYDHRVRVGHIKQMEWRPFCTEQKDRDDLIFFLFNSEDLDEREHAQLKQWLRRVHRPWVASSRPDDHSSFEPFGFPVDAGVKTHWYSSATCNEVATAD